MAEESQEEQQLTPEELAKQKKAGRWAAFWWTFSFIVHVSAVAALIYFSPLRKWFFQRRDPKETLDVSGHKVSKMVATMLEVQTKRIMEKVQLLQESLGEMTAMRENRYQSYLREFAYLKQSRQEVPEVEKLPISDPAEKDASLKGRDIPALYDLAIILDAGTYEAYRQMRAVELAKLQRLPLKQALDATRVAVPKHPEIDEAKLNLIIYSATDGKLDQLKDELGRINAEVNSMLAAAKRMLDLGHELIGDDVGSTVGYDTGGGGVTAGGGDDAERRRNRKAAFTGYSPPDPDAFTHKWGAAAGPIVHKNEILPHKAGADLGKDPPTPGRKLMKHGAKANWMYIDTWYIIGPFPNPGRQNLDKKFPPEAAIDLDATYVGKGGKRLKWEFRQFWQPCIAPHRPDNESIYYAYTQIYSDKEQERWCIFGSDDYGKAWMDDELIFASGKTPHPWIPDRAYKKVKFRKGYNAILFKLENAWGATGFSMCIYLGEM